MAIGDKKSAVMQSDIGIEGGVPSYLHASQHAADGSDPITPMSIGAERVYLNLSGIGCTAESTPTEVWTALPKYSVLYIDSGALTDASWAFPTTTAVMIMRKPINNNGRSEILLYSKGGTLWTMGMASNNIPSGTWKQLATTDYAVNKAGDTMTGALGFNNHGYVGGATDGTNWNAMLLQAQSLNGNGFTRFVLYGNDESPEQKLYLQNFNNEGAFLGDNAILHTGNKPSGSYTGNGNATERTIETGGIGGVIAVWNLSSTPRFAIIGPSGGVALTGSGTAALYVNNVYFTGGKLIVKATSEVVNGDGITYYYQVL